VGFEPTTDGFAGRTIRWKRPTTGSVLSCPAALTGLSYRPLRISLGLTSRGDPLAFMTRDGLGLLRSPTMTTLFTQVVWLRKRAKDLATSLNSRRPVYGPPSDGVGCSLRVFAPCCTSAASGTASDRTPVVLPTSDSTGFAVARGNLGGQGRAFACTAEASAPDPEVRRPGQTWWVVEDSNLRPPRQVPVECSNQTELTTPGHFIPEFYVPIEETACIHNSAGRSICWA
jgi:hypothetical protein